MRLLLRELHIYTILRFFFFGLVYVLSLIERVVEAKSLVSHSHLGFGFWLLYLTVRG